MGVRALTNVTPILRTSLIDFHYIQSIVWSNTKCWYSWANHLRISWRHKLLVWNYKSGEIQNAIDMQFKVMKAIIDTNYIDATLEWICFECGLIFVKYFEFFHMKNFFTIRKCAIILDFVSCSWVKTKSLLFYKILNHFCFTKYWK